MATRFYLPNAAGAEAEVSPAFTNGGAAEWTRTTEGIRRAMTPWNIGDVLANTQVQNFWGGAASASNDRALCAQFVSDPMEAGIAFSTSDTIKCQIRVLESATNDNINRASMCVKVYSRDGATRRAVLKGLDNHGPSTTEWPVGTGTGTNRRFADGDTLDAGYTTVAGDRLVIEVGGQTAGVAGSSITGRMHFGTGTGSTDLAEDDTSTSNSRPWFEISRDITWEAPYWAGSTHFSAGSGTDVTGVAKPTGAAVGDTVLLHLHVEESSSIGTPTPTSTSDTWTLVHDNINTTPTPDTHDWVWICNNLGSTSAIDIDWNGTNVWRDVGVHLFKGCDDTDPQDATATESQGSSSSASSAGVASGTALRQLTFIWSTFLEPIITSGGAGPLRHMGASGSENVGLATLRDVAGTNTTSKDMGFSTSQNWIAFLLALKPTVAAGGDPEGRLTHGGKLVGGGLLKKGVLIGG